MDYLRPEALVSTATLSRRLANAADVRVVDATWFMPGSPQTGRDAYLQRHIPGAVHFDIDEIADTSINLPHMMPSPEKFSSKVRKLGLGDGNRIVVYDANGGALAAHRVWWMFRVFGHEDVAVLDGGLPKWLAEGRSVEEGPPTPRERHFTARVDHALVRSLEQIRANLATHRDQVVDARSPGRFAGREQEPRPGVRPGRIPGSLNLPFAALMKKDENWTMRSAEEISAAVATAGLDLKRPIVATCGSGVTACTIAFGLYLIGCDRVAVYDGSWAEWGGRDDTPIET